MIISLARRTAAIDARGGGNRSRGRAAGFADRCSATIWLLLLRLEKRAAARRCVGLQPIPIASLHEMAIHAHILVQRPVVDGDPCLGSMLADPRENLLGLRHRKAESTREKAEENGTRGTGEQRDQRATVAWHRQRAYFSLIEKQLEAYPLELSDAGRAADELRDAVLCQLIGQMVACLRM
jgi:hypothetical protein